MVQGASLVGTFTSLSPLSRSLSWNLMCYLCHQQRASLDPVAVLKLSNGLVGFQSLDVGTFLKRNDQEIDERKIASLRLSHSD